MRFQRALEMAWRHQPSAVSKLLGLFKSNLQGRKTLGATLLEEFIFSGLQRRPLGFPGLQRKRCLARQYCTEAFVAASAAAERASGRLALQVFQFLNVRTCLRTREVNVLIQEHTMCFASRRRCHICSISAEADSVASFAHGNFSVFGANIVLFYLLMLQPYHQRELASTCRRAPSGCSHTAPPSTSRSAGLQRLLSTMICTQAQRQQ